MTAGRPTKYTEEYNEQVVKLCRLGATDAEIADFFEVSESTINLWKKEHSEFSESLKKGKVEADSNIAQSLYHRAKGYMHNEDKIFNNNGKELIVPTVKHYPPDTAAAIFWLKNRRKNHWRDKQEHEHSGPGGGPIQTQAITFNPVSNEPSND